MNKSVLIICPFDHIYPPMNGGMQRCFHVIHQLAKSTHLTLIIKQDKESFLLSSKDYPEIEKVNVISIHQINNPRDLFTWLPEKLEHALRFRWYKRKMLNSADSNFLRYYPILKTLLTNENFDAAILETPGACHPANVIQRWSKSTRIIYDAHNVDSNLEKALIGNKKVTDKSLKLIQKSERLLYKTVNEIFTCSEKDKEDYDKINKGRLKISVIPNGVVINEKLNDTAVRSDMSEQYLLFCGFLGTYPNTEGVLWFYEDILPEIKTIYPSVKLLVLGSGEIPASLEKLKKDDHIIFTGRVEDVKPIYEQSMVSIVPLKTGSGTRLKILEAMSYGVPVVSTTVGAEGIDYTEGHDILIADEKNAFAKKVICLLKNKEERLKIQQNARRLVAKKYDWNIIGKILAAVIYE